MSYCSEELNVTDKYLKTGRQMAKENQGSLNHTKKRAG